MQTNNLLQFIIVTIAVMETAWNLFERVDKLVSEHNARRNTQMSERNAQRTRTSNQRERTRNVERNARQQTSYTLL